MRILRPVLPILAVMLSTSTAWTGNLYVRVTDVKSEDGSIRIALHASPQGFPGAKAALEVRQIRAAPGRVTVVFPGLKPGEYAVALFHDENGNKVLDKNVFGSPKEGYGFSRNAGASFGPPRFSGAAFSVGAADTSISIAMRY